MISSPFGEKVHLRTALTADECCKRINEHIPTQIIDLGFDSRPVGFCKGRRISLWLPHGGNPPRLDARIIQHGVGCEVVGRAGGNAMLFIALATATVFATAVIAIEAASGNSSWLVIPFPAAAFFFNYMLHRQSPYGGKLIDFLQELLLAENILDRQSDPISRR